MATLDALRLLLWEDLPAPKEEEPPKVDEHRSLFPDEDDGEEMVEGEDEEAQE